MREFWIKIDSSLAKKEKLELVQQTSALSPIYLLGSDDLELVKHLQAKKIASPSDKGDIVVLKDLERIKEEKKKGKSVCLFIRVESKDDEKKIVQAAEYSVDYLIVDCPDWKIIPLENLIAAVHGKTKLLAYVSNLQEANTVLKTLEIGVDGVVTDISDANKIIEVYKSVVNVKTRKDELKVSKPITLLLAEVTRITPLDLGARVCIDTCDLMKEGEGILVGCQSQGLFLVEAEVHMTPFVEPRPFRVNAGSIALYVLTARGRTRYLSELKAGEEVLIVDRNGASRTANICRVKIEWRPLVMIEAKCKERILKTILQNAETIRVVTKDQSKSVSDLIEGDEILIRLEEGGRHFGRLVEEEKVIEK